MKLLSSVALAILLTVGGVGGAASAKDLVETATAAGQFSRLLKAATQAALSVIEDSPGGFDDKMIVLDDVVAFLRRLCAGNAPASSTSTR